MDTPEQFPRRGRRPGDPSTRESILDAAQALFAEHGYDRTTMRAVAHQAGTDPAMIRHWFGDKEGMFIATVVDRTPAAATLRAILSNAGPGDGRRIVADYLSLWEDPDTMPILLALVRTAVASGRTQASLMRLITAVLTRGPEGGGANDEHVTPPLVPNTAMVLVSSHLIGLALTRHVLQLPPAVAIEREVILDQMGPVIDGYLAAR
ncbi:TetR/AcrR family transcriptional regulator [Demequina sp.]|uniref:TetR/AcrR family transcriptional regulator n=1 Tax=Demequina sp. TaxID=2050685 RepID=UPI003A8AB236